MSAGHDYVLVCGGERCAARTDEVVDALRAVVRVAPHSVLIRTACLGPCRGAQQEGCEVAVQSVDASGQARRRPRRVGTRLSTPAVRARVARWLLEVDRP
ncbi:(2Fe-2S) ferredoxin domain-containing protein [Nocardioides flavescens]|uniref:(2Fe-2S) ferredoxin domain-containing protein n=1 Tax=Nocardioides flavescens TaxID=2691959 RepID=A0A6L7F338_9ACTN|nr:(2Fe-2S) ferredoxin domain-containing protein [Nocardioides flavescens]MXG90934.1 hypothetical protein [Nocardioides flavescens]